MADKQRMQKLSANIRETLAISHKKESSKREF